MKIHIVKRGETLTKIAKKYNIPFEQLQEINSHIKDAEKLTVGTKIKIPTASIRLKAKEAIPVSEQVEAKPVIPKIQPMGAASAENESMGRVNPNVAQAPEIPELPTYGYPPEMPEHELAAFESRQAAPPPLPGMPPMMPGVYTPGMMPQGVPPMMPGMYTPGMMPSGMVPPGMVPPGTPSMVPEMVSPEMGTPGMMPPGMPPMMPGMGAPGMMGPGMMPPGMPPMMYGIGTPEGMAPGMIPPGVPPTIPEMVYPEMMGPGMIPPTQPYSIPSQSGCIPCGGTPVYESPYGVPPYGMSPSMVSPMAASPFEGPDMNGPYDKRFFTQTHYPTPYHEQLYMREAAEGNDCRQEYMPPGNPTAVSPYMMSPMAPKQQHHDHQMHMYPSSHGPQMWEYDQGYESSSSCSSS